MIKLNMIVKCLHFISVQVNVQQEIRIIETRSILSTRFLICDLISFRVGHEVDHNSLELLDGSQVPAWSFQES